jgi:hypothetical protein
MSIVSWMRRLPIVASLVVLPSVAAQLAITEVHSSASTNGTVALHADWWELTNLGTQPVDLTGYRFNDATGGLAAGSVTLPSLTLAAGESMVLVEAISADDFRQWWGAGLPAGLQIFTYTTNGIGLSSSGDSVQLWGPTTTNELAWVDSVVIGAAGLDSSTFIYDPITGQMSARSVAGQGGAFAAADNGDAGSPGVSGSAVPLEILQQPSDVVVNPGDSATFTVTARGLPRARYQWKFGGQVIPGAIRSQLVVSNVSAASAGGYTVELANGLEQIQSRAAVLTLAESPKAPVFTMELTNQAVLAGGTVVFQAAASGVPQPTFVWRFGTTVLPDVTGSQLILTNVAANAAGTYSVTATNASGVVVSTAVLTVRAKPDLRITEVRSTDTLDPDFSRRNGFTPQDWFEVTSFESSPISLLGWRLDDNSSSLSAAYVVTNAVTILPGESVIFVERLTADQFKVWWGTNELPAGLKIITYSGSGFGFSSGGDGVRIWDPTTANNTDTVSTVDFPAGTAGVTFNYDLETSTFGSLSVEGVNGVYQAPGSIDRDLNLTVKDIGSPGRVREGGVVLPPRAPELSVVLDGTILKVRFEGQAGRAYRLERRTLLVGGSWESIGAATGIDGTVEINAGAPGDSQGFFRVVVP